VSYYQGDYYQGDVWGRIGKGIRRAVKDVGRVLQPLAPIAGLVVPALAIPAGVARGIKTAKAIREVARAVTTTGTQPSPHSPAPVIMSELTGQTVGMPGMSAPVLRAAAPMGSEDMPVRSYRPRQGNREAVITDHNEWKRWMEAGGETNAAGVPIIRRTAKRRRPAAARRRKRTTTRARSRSRSRSRR
jgi:hypothetical protein